MSRFAKRLSSLPLNLRDEQIRSPSPHWASQGDKIILFLGVTGSGKSSFIRAITNHNDVEVGHGLCSETETVRAFHTTIESIKFMLVDTPGFNDTFRDDEEILMEITDWLATTYKQGKKITGVIYLHPINQPRMEGSSLLNLTVMQKLCGSETFENVVLASTFWDLVEEDSGIRREKELCQTPQFWGGMERNGSSVIRIQDYAQSKDVLLQLAGKREVALQVQREMVEDEKKLSDTTAGQKLNQELARLQKEHQQQKRAMEERAQAELKLREEQNQRKLAEELGRQMAAHRFQRELIEERQRTEQRIQQEKLEEKRRLARQAEREAEKERQRLKDIQLRKEKLAQEQRQMEAAQMERAKKERKKRELIAKNVLAARYRAEMRTQREVFFEACSRWTVNAFTFTFENQAPDFINCLSNFAHTDNATPASYKSANHAGKEAITAWMMAKPTESRAILEDISHPTVAPDSRKVNNRCSVIGMVVRKSSEGFTSIVVIVRMISTTSVSSVSFQDTLASEIINSIQQSIGPRRLWFHVANPGTNSSFGGIPFSTDRNMYIVHLSKVLVSRSGNGAAAKRLLQSD